MAIRMRRVTGGSTENIAHVLATGEHWESLRAAYWGHHKQYRLANGCCQLAREYEIALADHLQKINKE